MSLENGVIIGWSGTHASIPTGYTRVTGLDSKYLKGTAVSVEPDVTGGNATHTHTVGSAHTHTASATHTHTASTGAGSGGSQSSDLSPTFSNSPINLTHTHPNATTGASSGGTLDSQTPTYGSVDNDPPYYTLIFIQSNGTEGLPQNSIGWFTGSSVPSGFYQCDGNNSTINLTDKFIKGAGTGANSGNTGGSLTNVHTLTHTHGVASHTHSVSISASADEQRRRTNTGSGLRAVTEHTHSVTFNSADTLSAGNPSLTTSENVQPTFYSVLMIQNTSLSTNIPIGYGAYWLGTRANIPSNWQEKEVLRTKYIKITNTIGDIAVSGGANTHTHTNNTHTHTSAGHTHTATASHANSTDTQGSGNAVADGATSTHAVTSTSTSPTYETITTSGESSSNEPEYRTVLFIEKYKDGIPSVNWFI